MKKLSKAVHGVVFEGLVPESNLEEQELRGKGYVTDNKGFFYLTKEDAKANPANVVEPTPEPAPEPEAAPEEPAEEEPKPAEAEVTPSEPEAKEEEEPEAEKDGEEEPKPSE